jgi:plastocyanin
MKKILYFLPLLLLFLLSESCYKSSVVINPGTNEVYIQNDAFNPATITVVMGTTVKWTNKDSHSHTVTSGGLFDSGDLKKDETFSHTFTSLGTYTYKCSIHSNMSGSVVVQ